MSNFNLADYDTVDSRIKKFYTEHDDGRILTEMVSDKSNLENVIFRAEILMGNVVKSTGYAHEVQGAGFVNKTSHLENCETSAIGRGLANLGYSGNKRASREEMEKVERMETMKKSVEYKGYPTKKDFDLDYKDCYNRIMELLKGREVDDGRRFKIQDGIDKWEPSFMRSNVIPDLVKLKIKNEVKIPKST